MTIERSTSRPSTPAARRPAAKLLTTVVLAASATMIAFGNARVAEADTPIELDTSTIDFGAVAIGGTAESLVTMTNPGDEPFGPIVVTIQQVAAPFSVDDTGCSDVTLAPGGTCTISITFAPMRAGDFATAAEGQFNENTAPSNPEQFTIVLSGRGVDGSPTVGGENPLPGLAPATTTPNPSITTPPLESGNVDTPLEIDVTAVDFGEVDERERAIERVTVTNTGPGPFGPITSTFDPPLPAPFGVSDSCSGETVPAGETCVLVIAFHPMTTGGFTHDMRFLLGATASPTDSEEFTVALTGEGVRPSISFPEPGGQGGDVGTLTPVTTEPEAPPTSAPEAPRPAPLDIDATSLDFGVVQVGQTSLEQSVTVTNDSGEEFGPVNLGYTVPADPQFGLAGETCDDTTLAPGASCRVTFVFAPAVAGSANSSTTLVLSTVGSTAPSLDFTISLGGFGFPRPQLPGGSPVTIDQPSTPPTTPPGGGVDTPLEIDVNDIDFGEVPIGSNATLEAVVTNAGSAAVGPITIGLGPPNAPFGMQQVCNPGVTLQPGESCPFRFTFTAFAPGEFSSPASIVMSETGSVVDGELAGEVFELNLTGTAIAAGGALIEVDATSLDFGDVAIGGRAELSVTISNFGDAAFGPIAVLDEAPSAPEFAFVGSSCDGVTLAPGDSCRHDYAFSPLATGDFAADVIVSISDPAADDPDREFVIALTGTGTPPAVGPRLEIDATSLHFGTVDVGETSAEQSVRLSNTGDEDFGPMTILGGIPDASGFFVVAVTCAGQTLAPGESCAVDYAFRPSAPGPLAASSSFTLTDGNDRGNDQEFTVELAGTGAGAVDTALEIDVTDVDFGEVNVGNVSSDSVATVTNTGSTPFGPIGAFFDPGLLGPVALPFQASHNCGGVTLAAGGTCTIALRFQPIATGAFSDVAALTLSDTGIPAGGERFTIDVTGTGLFPLTVAPTSLDFGDVAVGTVSPPLLVILTNSSSDPFGPLRVGQEPPDLGFAIGAESCSDATLAPGGTCFLGYEFAPVAAGDATDTVTFDIAPAGSPPPNDGPPIPPAEFTLTLSGCGSDAAVPCTETPPTTTESTTTTEPTTSTTVVVGAPAVRLDKTSGGIDDVDGNGADAGDTVTYFFVVTNVGQVALDAVTVSDPTAGGTVPCGTGPLQPGESRTCDTAVYALTAGDLGGTLYNTAEVTALSVNDGIEVIDTDTEATEVPPACAAPDPPTEAASEGTEPAAGEPTPSSEPVAPTESIPSGEPVPSSEQPTTTDPPESTESTDPEPSPGTQPADPGQAPPPATEPAGTAPDETEPQGFARSGGANSAAAAGHADPCRLPPTTSTSTTSVPDPPADPTVPGDPAPVGSIADPPGDSNPPELSDPAIDPDPTNGPASPGSTQSGEPATTSSRPDGTEATAVAGVGGATEGGGGTDGGGVPTPPPGLLPATGGSGQVTIVLLATALLGAGAVLVVIVRRRHVDRMRRS